MQSVLPPSPRTSRFRHIVFDPGRRQRVVNFAPAHPTASALPARFLNDPSSSLSEEEESFLLWLFRRADLDAHIYRPETLRRRLAACLRALRVHSIDDARQLLQREPAQIPLAIGAIVIGVTSFFRDAGVFDHLTYTVLPALPKPPQQRRIWCAGCSDGDEVYSLAVLLAEMHLLDGAYLLGTDCRPHAIARAKEACYDAAALRGVPQTWLDRYFTPAPGARTHRAAEHLRRACQWRVADLTRVIEPGNWDLILCRNLAMYFRPEFAGPLWQQLQDALRPGGFLVLGKAERPVGATRLSFIAPCIYRRDRG